VGRQARQKLGPLSFFFRLLLYRLDDEFWKEYRKRPQL
jgi:hypothetical protein